MKNITKTGLFIAGFFALILLSVSISAEKVVDESGDIYHWHMTEGSYGWDTAVDNKPNIDILELSYTTGSDQVTVSLRVAGSISNSELITYWAYLNTSDSNYFLSWNNGEGTGWATSTQEGSYTMDFEPTITANLNTITATFDSVGSFETGIELWGWAAEYTQHNDMSSEWWGDWAPESYAAYDGTDSDDDEPVDDTDPGDSTDTDDTDTTEPGDTNTEGQTTTTPPPSGTPGFEFLALIAAFAAILFIVKKRN
ncbi:MAG: hypothetical protein KGY67_04660 [Candidatus Thermoplasmatota archaeon]|nr:hypothetical protein [Candidatus Thermoplasmatota archaeon]